MSSKLPLLESDCDTLSKADSLIYKDSFIKFS